MEKWQENRLIDLLTIDVNTVGAMSALLDITDHSWKKNIFNNTVDLHSKCLLKAAKKTFGEYPQAPVNNVKKCPKRTQFDNNSNT